METTKNDIEKEILLNEADKRNCDEELELLKKNYANSLSDRFPKKGINGYYYKPIKYRKPLYVRISEFINKIKYVFCGL